MKSYTVYMHISPSNKKYIGITCQKPENRWNDGKGYKTQKYFTNAINKYGWENFQHIIIAKGLAEEEACWLEIELIREWDTTNQNNGYNLSLGGNNSSPTEETRKKMSENNGKPWEGKLLSSEHKNKISDTRIKEGVAKGKRNPSARAVICITTKKIFDTAKEGAEYYNCNNSHIGGCCRGERKSCGKLPDGTKLVWKYLDEYLMERGDMIE